MRRDAVRLGQTMLQHSEAKNVSVTPHNVSEPPIVQLV